MSVELLSPAGDFETALAAFSAGADAVYCGLSGFSARAFAKNLTQRELSDLSAYARATGRKVYVAFNTLIDSGAMDRAVETLSAIDDASPDAIIVQDLGAARIARKFFPKLELHASTQLVAHNLEGVLAMRELGFRRVVLARELSLEEIRSIARRCGAMKTADDGRPQTELEVFIHGALCYSVSGLCLFGAMEGGRSGNRGECPYCCRRNFAPPREKPFHPFSMKDLRLDSGANRLVEAGVSSLKIEGRMKSPLYVASVTRRYRDILDGAPESVSLSDLETVFSRRTTRLRFDGKADDPIDSESVGHLGAFIGRVKKVARDRDGSSWLRFHSSRALEKHDGLQFDAIDAKGRHIGMGIGDMRVAISRKLVFATPPDADVEVRIDDPALAGALTPGTGIYCSMSNAVKRMFPVPSFRPSEFPGGRKIDVAVAIDGNKVVASLVDRPEVAVSEEADFAKAEDPGKTAEAVRKAFSRLGGTAYSLGSVEVSNPEGFFVPSSALNALRRAFVARLDELSDVESAERGKAISEELDRCRRVDSASPVSSACARVKVRLGQDVPEGDWDEVVISLPIEDAAAIEEKLEGLSATCAAPRLALPPYVPETSFARLRAMVGRLARLGFRKWECSDLATLRMLKAAGVSDISADWTLYAFNSAALAELSESGVKRFVASPENGAGNLTALASSGYDIEFLSRQSTPLFISLNRPAVDGEPPFHVSDLVVFRRDGLWATVKSSPRSFDVPEGASRRVDISWDPSW